MSDIYNILTSDGNKPFLNIKCNTLDAESNIEAASIDLLNGPAAVGLINFTQLPLVPSPTPAHTIMVCDSTDDGRPTINNGITVHKLAYVDDPDPAENSIIADDASCGVTCNNGGTISSFGGTWDIDGAVMNNVQKINGYVPTSFDILKSNVQLSMDTNLVATYLGGNARVYISDTSSQLIGPDLFSSVKVLNDNVNMSITSFGPQVYADNVESYLKHDTEKLTLSGGVVDSTVPIQCPSININNNYDLPTTAPTNGQIISTTGGSPAWVSAFNGFQAQYKGAGITVGTGASTQNICDTLLLGSGYNVGTFTYTAPLTGIYEMSYTVNWQWTSTVNPANGRLDSAFRVDDGGVTFPGYLVNRVFAPLAVTEPFNGINTITIFKQLNSGALVQISVANNSSANDMLLTTDNTFFSVRLIQET